MGPPKQFPTTKKYKSTPKQRSAVRKILEENSRRVATLPQRHVDAIVPAIEQAQREVANDLGRWLTSIPDGSVRFTAQLYRNLLIQIRGSMGAMKKMAPAIAGELRRGSKHAAAVALENNFDELSRLSHIFGGSVKPIPINLAGIIASGDSFLIPRFESSAKRYDEYTQADIRRQIAVGVIRDESVDQMANRIQRLGTPDSVPAEATGESMAEGLFGRYENAAERVIRTELISAYNTHTGEIMNKYAKVFPGLRQRWDASMDSRTCFDCEGLDGEVTDLNGTFSTGDDGAPAHPNCRCRVGSWMEEWNEILDEED